ncbi:MAG: hypothetical protein V2A54_03645 [Bacteroidota bacterium]
MKRIYIIIFCAISLLLICAYSQSFAQAPTIACSTPATLLTVGGACGSGTISDATVADAPVPTCGTALRDGWFRFVATASYATIRAVTTSRQLLVQVFSGACGSLTQIGCANANTTAGAQTETVDLTGLTIGNTYYIRIVNETANNMTLTSVCVTANCHTIRLTDTYGDGWTDGTNPDGWVTVTVNGTPVLTNLTLTVAEASGPVSYSFPATGGDVINVTMTGSPLYASEMRVELLGAGGSLTLIPIQQPVATPGITVTGCCNLTVPGLATYTAPANGSTGAPSCGLDLTWTAPVNSGCNAATSYDVYFGTAASPPFVTNTTSTTYGTGALAVTTTYYWKIVPKNAAGVAGAPVIWSFTTGGSSVPGLATYTAPANGSTGNSTCARLTWNAPSNTGCSAATSYDVYFGTAAIPPFVINTAALVYVPALAVSTTYYWKIVPKNAYGDAVGAATWSFTTGTAIYPGNISAGLPKMWFKANMGVSYAGTNATDWANQFCGSAITLLNTAGADPQYLSGSNASAINFNPVLSFNGTTQYFKTLSSYDFNDVGSRSGTNWQMESFAVTHGSGTGSLVYAWQPTGMITPGNKVGVDVSFAYFDGQGHLGVTMNWGVANANIITTSPLILGTSAIQGVQMTNYVDLLSYTSPGNVEPMDGSYLTAPFAIGCLDNNGGAPDFYYNGRVCEVITYGNLLSALQRNKINSYLAVKYGITLGHNVISGGVRNNYTSAAGASIWTSAVGGNPMYDYHNDVTGVGCENIEGLHQRQAMSQNAVTAPAFQVTMGIGAIAADNITNPNNLTDATYMLWGNDGANATSWTVAVAGTVPALVRIARIWKVQETGVVGTMKVRIPASAFGGVTPTNVYLITSADATFTSADIFTTMTLVGSNWECDYNFSNYQYFTFCRTNTVLPIELISFDAQCKNNKNIITWSTASETNNDYFTLERSNDANNFIPVSTISGHGNTNSVHNYSYTDEIQNGQETYYRLSQTDFDGTKVMLGIVSTQCSQLESENAEINYCQIINDNQTILNLTIPSAGYYNISVVDMLGRFVYQKEYSFEPGTFNVYTPRQVRGVYAVTLSGMMSTVSKKIVQ